MSADNWTDCPKCRAKAFDSLSKREQKHAESYGKISSDKWLDNQRDLAASRHEIESGNCFQTFREVYQLGVDCGGNFYVSYRGSCTKCGAAYAFKHEVTEAV